MNPTPKLDVELLSQTLTIKNRLGLHARAAAKLAEAASEFKANVTLSNGEISTDARSILGILTLGCSFQSELFLTADGEDAREALLALANLIEDKFGEV